MSEASEIDVVDIAPAAAEESPRETLERAFEAHDDVVETKPPREDGRDAVGRFAPKRNETETEAPADKPVVTEMVTTETGDKPTTEAAPERLPNAPQSWKPEEREHWKQMPVAAREAVARREAEIVRGLSEASEAKRGIEAIRGVIAPYMANIQAANGGDVVGSMKAFFDYDNRLRHGNQIEKAQAVTALIKSYGVDINALDSELAGAPHDPRTQQQTELQAALQRELAPMQQHLQQLQARDQERTQYSQQQFTTKVASAIDQFAAQPENKHFHTVASDMADILDFVSGRGQNMSLKEAYETACWQNPKVRSMMIAEQQNQTIGERTQTAHRARQAAVGVTGSPRVGALPVVAGGGKDDRLGDIRAAFDAQAGRE